MDTQSMGGALYYVLFKDNYTRFRFEYFINKKIACFKKLLNWIQNERKYKVTVLYLDWTREYINGKFNLYVQE
jgi:hypothetical protein